MAVIPGSASRPMCSIFRAATANRRSARATCAKPVPSLKTSTAAGTAIRRDDERVTLPSYRELRMSGVRRWGYLVRSRVRASRPERAMLGSMLGRFAAVLLLAGALGGCGYDAVVHSWFDRSGGPEPLASQK